MMKEHTQAAHVAVVDAVIFLLDKDSPLLFRRVRNLRCHFVYSLPVCYHGQV